MIMLDSRHVFVVVQVILAVSIAIILLLITIQAFL